MTIQTFGSANALIHNNQGITFGKDQRARSAAATIEARWDTTIPPRPEAVEAEERLAALSTLRNKYSNHLDFAELIKHHPIDEWESAIEGWATTATISELINGNYQMLWSDLRAMKNNRLNPEEQFEWVMKHIDPAPAVKEFTALANTLGNAVSDVDTAFATNPEALVKYRTAGLKLLALSSLKAGMTFDELPHRLFTPALFSKIEELPHLSRYHARGKAVDRHTEQDIADHFTIDDHITLAETNPAAYLTHLAQGNIPHLTLDVARTTDEWYGRVAQLNELHTIHPAATPDKTPRRRGTVTTGPAGTTFTPNKED